MNAVVLSRHEAEARRRIAGRFRIDVGADNQFARTLYPPPPKWYEAEPHCTDALWRLFVVRAIEKRARVCEVDPRELARFASSSVPVADAILKDAAQMLHDQALFDAKSGVANG